MNSLFRKIQNLDKFQNLKSLVLDNNEITDLSGFPSLENLETLWLNGNNLDDIENVVRNLQKLPALKHLSLLKNPCCPNEFTGNDVNDYKLYRLYVLHFLTNLKHLDAYKVEAPELSEAQRRGQFCKVSKPDYDKLEKQRKANETADDNRATSDSSSLQQPSRPDGKNVSYFGYTKHVYTGKHSEGNRFIKNNDL